MEVMIGVSNRHVHLTKGDLETLFGKGFELESLKPINQPGQFASTSKVTLKTEKATIADVRILGPVRPYTQIEISKTDAYKLGLNPPIRESGDVAGSSPITLVGPMGELNLKEGCIIADRHIHMLPNQVKMYGLTGISKVNVIVRGEKGGLLANVNIRVSDKSYYEMHLDTDDANAHMLKSGDIVEILMPK